MFGTTLEIGMTGLTTPLTITDGRLKLVIRCKP